MWLVASHVLRSLTMTGAGWDVWTFLPLIAATIPYSGHAIEPWVPPPYSTSGTFVHWREWIAQSAPARMLAMAVFAPAHVAVELLSAPRNIVVLLVAAISDLGLAGGAIHALHARVARVIAAPQPPLTRKGYRAAVLGSGA